MFKITMLLLSLFFFHSCLCQESLHIVTLHRGDSSYITRPETMGVAVDQENINEVSNSVLSAENWLRANVLSYYPSSNINFIVVVPNDHLCKGGNIKLIMDSVKNLYHSLIRWGLEKDIKVSVSVASDCLHNSYLNPVFTLLEKINSTYTVKLLSSELKSMNDMDVFRPETVNVILPKLKQVKSTFRKLSFIDDLWSAATPPPPVVVQLSPAPAPVNVQFPPEVQSPASSPSHPYGYSLPPCYPNYPQPSYHADPPVVGSGSGPMAGPPMVIPPMAAPPALGGHEHEQLWCVAKPSVPSDKLQVALDYACGAGGADCGPIRPNGSCFSPDSVVAHASYAFNSYWQKSKRNGGMCGFEGTAMLISTDPSFLHCHFVLG